MLNINVTTLQGYIYTNTHTYRTPWNRTSNTLLLTAAQFFAVSFWPSASASQMPQARRQSFVEIPQRRNSTIPTSSSWTQDDATNPSCSISTATGSTVIAILPAPSRSSPWSWGSTNGFAAAAAGFQPRRCWIPEAPWG